MQFKIRKTNLHQFFFLFQIKNAKEKQTNKNIKKKQQRALTKNYTFYFFKNM